MTNELKFTAQIEDADIYGINKYLALPLRDIATSKPTVYIDFHLEIEARNYGVKGIDIFIDKVYTSIEWEVNDEYLTGLEKMLLLNKGKYNSGNIEGTLELNTSEKPFDAWEIKNEMTVTEFGGIHPDNVEIDFKNKVITIN